MNYETLITNQANLEEVEAAYEEYLDTKALERIIKTWEKAPILKDWIDGKVTF